MAEEMFKTTLMGGFDKDDVLAKVKNMKDEAYLEKNKLIKAGKEKDKKIKDLQNQLNLKNVQREQEIEELEEKHRQELQKMEQSLALKNAQKEKLEQEISEKYLLNKLMDGCMHACISSHSTNPVCSPPPPGHRRTKRT